MYEQFRELVCIDNDLADLKKRGEELKFRLQSMLTMQIYHLGKAGEIDLHDVFRDPQARNVLGRKIREHVGFKPPDWKLGDTRDERMARTIAAVTFQKCARVALYLLENNVDPKVVLDPEFKFIIHTAKGPVDMRARAKRKYDKPQSDTRHQ